MKIKSLPLILIAILSLTLAAPVAAAKGTDACPNLRGFQKVVPDGYIQVTHTIGLSTLVWCEPI